MTAWIHMTPYADSEGYLRELYDRVKGPDNNVDNVMKIHSLRPHTMEGHSAIYKSILHHTGNTTPTWFLEALGVYTCLSNKCDYAVSHHFAGMSRLVDDQERSNTIYKAFVDGKPENAFEGKELALLQYVRKLTLHPDQMEESDIAALHDAGADDGEIFEANQVCAYFNYSNRLLNGLGVTTKGDILGLSPPTSEDMNSWKHA